MLHALPALHEARVDIEEEWYPFALRLLLVAWGEAPPIAQRIGRVSGMQISADDELSRRQQLDRQVSLRTS